MGDRSTVRRICVFCGSHLGSRPAFVAAAEAVGKELAARGLTLVYGGGSVGLMGVVANAALAANGEVVGVIPRDLFAAEVAHRGISRLYEVGSMHERKALMADLADAFLVLPGGLGTFDELIEMLTWNLLGIQRKPIGLLDLDGFFAPLLAQLDRAIADGFLQADSSAQPLRSTAVPDLLDRLQRGW